MSGAYYRATMDGITVTAVGGFLAGRNGRMAHLLLRGNRLPEGVDPARIAVLLDNNMIELVEPSPAEA